ncbi:MAG: DUF4349 domain-containing protein [Vulcanimicrobiota bacterium]
MKRYFLICLSLALMVSTLSEMMLPVLAQERSLPDSSVRKRMVQVSISATVLSENLTETTRKINDISAQFKGTVQSLNFDSNNSSGNAQILIPPDKASFFMAEIQCLGEVQNQQLSTNDYSRSYIETMKKLKCYERISQIPTEKLGGAIGLTGEEKATFLEEFSNLVRNQISSMKSSLDSYEKNGEYAAVSIYIRKKGSANQNANTAAVEIAEIHRDISDKSPRDSRCDFMLLLPIYLLILLILILVYRLHKQIKKTPLGS